MLSLGLTPGPAGSPRPRGRRGQPPPPPHPTPHPGHSPERRLAEGVPALTGGQGRSAQGSAGKPAPPELCPFWPSSVSFRLHPGSPCLPAGAPSPVECLQLTAALQALPCGHHGAHSLRGTAPGARAWRSAHLRMRTLLWEAHCGALLSPYSRAPLRTTGSTSPSSPTDPARPSSKCP